MACWARIDTNRPIQNGGAYGNAPELRSVAPAIMQGTTESLSATSNYHTVLDSRYKIGGTTTWERPGQA